MGANTTNSYFYKPSLGASGTTELAAFDAALDATDLAIKDLVDNKQPLDAGLTSIAGLTTAANKMIYTTALDTYAVASLTAFARSILDDADEATFKATVNLEIGTDVLAEQTIGISDNNLLEVDGSPNNDEYARFTANGLEGRTEAEFKADFNLEIGTDVLAEQTIGIANDNLVEIDHASVADNDYAKFTANGLEGRSYSQVRTDLGLFIGTNVQAFDNALTSISGLTYVSASFIKLTANDTYAVRTLAQTLTDIGGAASGGNSDITALTGLTTALGANYGGTGVLNNALNTITFTGNYTLGLTLTANTSITLPTTGTLATTALKLSAFAATTSAELKGVISDETGSGALVFANTPTLVTPVLGAATATSINFGDTALNYYKEGTWTPALKFGGNSNNMTYSVQSGLYTKTGRQVTITAKITLTNKGDSTGDAIIVGLPFTCKNSDAAISPAALWLDSISFADFPQGYAWKGSTIIYFFEITNAGSTTTLTNTNFANNSTMVLSITYFTD